MPARHVVVDGSNIATEGNSLPSLKQLDEAVREYLRENPDDIVTVVVDATFGHRIRPEEREMFDQAEREGDIVSPPAGAIGRGDAFLLRIADKIGAVVLSNDSFQEFHGEHEWLFDKGRLIGGKPVPGVGWIFTPRSPVRGPKSRESLKEAKRKRKVEDGEQPEGSGLELAGERSHSKPGDRKLQKAIATATEEAVLPEKAARKRRRRRHGGETPSEPVNEPLTFISFIASYRPGDEVEGVVEEFSSHGAYISVGGARCYLPLSAMGPVPPRSAREVLRKGERRIFVVQAFDAIRRGIELALPGFVHPAGAPTPETVEAEILEGPSWGSGLVEEPGVQPAGRRSRREVVGRREPASLPGDLAEGDGAKKVRRRRATAREETVQADKETAGASEKAVRAERERGAGADGAAQAGGKGVGAEREPLSAGALRTGDGTRRARRRTSASKSGDRERISQSAEAKDAGGGHEAVVSRQASRAATASDEETGKPTRAKSVRPRTAETSRKERGAPPGQPAAVANGPESVTAAEVKAPPKKVSASGPAKAGGTRPTASTAAKRAGNQPAEHVKEVSPPHVAAKVGAPKKGKRPAATTGQETAAGRTASRRGEVPAATPPVAAKAEAGIEAKEGKQRARVRSASRVGTSGDVSRGSPPRQIAPAEPPEKARAAVQKRGGSRKLPTAREPAALAGVPTEASRPVEEEPEDRALGVQSQPTPGQAGATSRTTVTKAVGTKSGTGAGAEKGAPLRRTSGRTATRSKGGPHLVVVEGALAEPTRATRSRRRTKALTASKPASEQPASSAPADSKPVGSAPAGS